MRINDMLLKELKFKNLPAENDIILKWEKLPDNYKHYFIDTGVRELVLWLNDKIKNNIGTTLKLLRYMVPPKTTNKYMYRGLSVENDKVQYFKYVRNTLKQKGIMSVTTGYSKYQSWSATTKGVMEVLEFTDYKNYIIFKAPVQNIYVSIPEVIKHLPKLLRHLNMTTVISDITDFDNEKEFIIKTENRKINISNLKITSR